MNKTLLACALALAACGSANAATITLVNVNGAGVGLNDTTAATPVGLNPGVTIGEQRRIAYQFAADLWGSILQSNVEIKVEAQFTPLSCTSTSAVLGSAGALTIHGGFSGAAASTWYGAALANSIAGTDLGTATNDIASRFNSNLGNAGCFDGAGWYYGLDGNTPAGKTNFLDVVMHELGHGLNFQGFHNVSTGAPPSGTQPTWGDIYSNFAFDNVSGKAWTQMTNAERQAAAVSGNVVFTGPTVTAQVPATLAPLTRLAISGAVTGSYFFTTAAFGPAPTVANLSGQVVLANDGSASPTLGCVASPAGAYTGKIVLIDRGTCVFKLKAKLAQDAGAKGVIIASNSTAALGGMADDPAVPAVNIAAVLISQADGAAVKAAIPSGVVSGGAAVVPGRYSGADVQGRAQLYSPTTVEPGSSFSHYDVSATPNAIMEPAINQDLDANFRLDLTPALFQDLGWVLNPGTAKTKGGTCETGVPIVTTPGLIGGANLTAADKLCATTAGSGTNAAYVACMAPFAKRLKEVGLLKTTISKVAATRCTQF